MNILNNIRSADKMKSQTLLFNAKIYAEEEIIDNGYILIEDNKIIDIGEGELVVDKTTMILIDIGGKTIIPGFIDLQVNGAGGYLVTDTDEKHFNDIAYSLARCGTTSFLAATAPCTDDEHRKILRFIGDIKKNNIGAKVLGVHMEGPFLNPEKSGANNPLFVSDPNPKKFQKFLAEGTLKIMTISPETGTFDEIYNMAERNGVVLSIGHSLANYDQAISAFSKGCKMATHLFNTMNGINAREPGVVVAAKDSKNVKGTVICDGHHVHPSILKILYETFGADRLILITDSAPTSASDRTEWDFEGMKIFVKGYTCFSEKGTIMGSSLTMNKAAMFAKRYMECSTQDIIKMGAINPANILNIQNAKGCIKIGMDADLLVVQDESEFDPLLVFVEGELVYQK